MTFSIAARCPDTGMLGVAVSSSSPAVAARCAFVRPRTGAVLSQNVTDPRLGTRLLDLLGLDRLTEDGAAGSDESFDFRPGFSIKPADGLIIFPYLEPFGSRMQAIVDAAAESEAERASLSARFVFNALYWSTAPPSRP